MEINGSDRYLNKYRIPSNRLRGWNYAQNGHYFITIVTKDRKEIFGKIVDGQMILNNIGEIVNAEFLKSFEMRNELYLGEYVIMPNHIHAILILDNDENDVAANDHIGTHDIGTGFKSSSINRIDDWIDNVNGGHMGDDYTDDDHAGTHGRIVGTHDIGTHDIGTRGVGTDDVGTHGVGTDDIGTHDIGTDDVGTHDIGTDDIGTDDHVKTHGRASLQPQPQPQPCDGRAPQPRREPKSISSFVAGFKSSSINRIDDWIDNANNDGHANVYQKFNKNNPLWQANYHDHIIRNETEYRRIAKYIVNNPLKWNEDTLSNVELNGKEE